MGPLLQPYKDGPVFKEFMVTLQDADADLFRFMADARLASTNNAAERGLREITAHGKIRGGLRSEKTMSWMADLFACAHTWKNRDLDWKKETAKYV